jgi:hypothetical protein
MRRRSRPPEIHTSGTPGNGGCGSVLTRRGTTPPNEEALSSPIPTGDQLRWPLSPIPLRPQPRGAPGGQEGPRGGEGGEVIKPGQGLQVGVLNPASELTDCFARKPVSEASNTHPANP